jgi:cbb3-type cytochrome oxidase subunit 3
VILASFFVTGVAIFFGVLGLCEVLDAVIAWAYRAHRTRERCRAELDIAPAVARYRGRS